MLRRLYTNLVPNAKRWKKPTRSQRLLRVVLVIAFALSLPGYASKSSEPRAGASGPVSIATVFDNLVLRPGLTQRWGFAAVVTTPSAVVLFDTGSDGPVLLSNMKEMRLAPENVTAIVISHIHQDHSGGLRTFLKANPKVTVYLPTSFPNSLRQMVRRAGARTHDVHAPETIATGIHTTGQMDGHLYEQALVVETREGLVVLTGCGHPGIVRMVEQARAVVPDKPVNLVMGGFHLMHASDSEIESVIRDFRRLGVKRVAPSHCTGDRARARFKKAFGTDYVPGGLGGVLVFR